MKKLSFLFALTIYTISFGQYEATEQVGLIIIQTTDDYNEALKTAIKAEQSLNSEIQFKGTYFEEGMLKNDIECGCGEAHGYLRRGRFDHGMYISIEMAYDYTGGNEGEFHVIVGSHQMGNEELLKYLNEVKESFPKAYIHEERVYVGCMH